VKIEKPAAGTRRVEKVSSGEGEGTSADASLLPRALLVTIRLQAFPALALVHLQTTLLLQVAHGVRVERLRGAGMARGCKLIFPKGRIQPTETQSRIPA
jgi:hypothetical protein